MLQVLIKFNNFFLFIFPLSQESLFIETDTIEVEEAIGQ